MNHDNDGGKTNIWQTRETRLRQYRVALIKRTFYSNEYSARTRLKVKKNNNTYVVDIINDGVIYMSRMI